MGGHDRSDSVDVASPCAAARRARARAAALAPALNWTGPSGSATAPRHTTTSPLAAPLAQWPRVLATSPSAGSSDAEPGAAAADRAEPAEGDYVTPSDLVQAYATRGIVAGVFGYPFFALPLWMRRQLGRFTTTRPMKPAPTPGGSAHGAVAAEAATARATIHGLNAQRGIMPSLPAARGPSIARMAARMSLFVPLAYTINGTGLLLSQPDAMFDGTSADGTPVPLSIRMGIRAASGGIAGVLAGFTREGSRKAAKQAIADGTLGARRTLTRAPAFYGVVGMVWGLFVPEFVAVINGDIRMRGSR